jgi:ferric-dicitrate binding protein FerR (iron transport regulator)
VELQGEAYFEIARNASMPFKVSIVSRKGSAPAEIEVLGTHFNIKAYADEPTVRATLLEGSVRVRKGGAALPLQPGQQASWTGTTDINVATADVEEAIAWKNGLFKFSEATVEDVMRQLSRWYDVEVVYTNGIPKDLFQGEMYRNVNVSRVLKVLEASGVHFTVDGKKILVQ